MKIMPLVCWMVWAIVAVVSVLLYLPGVPMSDVASGLDETWKYALQVAFEGGFVFGRDFVFTYGPLGFLGARVADPDTAPYIFAYDHFVWIQMLVAPWAIYRMTSSRWSIVLFALVIFTLANARYYQDPAVTLFLLSTFWFYIDRSRGSLLIFSIAVINALLAFYIKVNLGLAALLQIFAIHTFFLCFSSSRGQSCARLALAALFAISSLGFVSVSLFEYVQGALHIANGYNDAMYLDVQNLEHFNLAQIVLGCLTASLLVVCWYSKQFFLAATCAGFSYLLFKQAFVRADEHVFVFFDYIAVPFALLALFGRQYARLFHSCVFVGVAGVSIYLNQPSIDFLSNKMQFTTQYYRSFDQLSQRPPLVRPVAAELLDVVGNSTIDCMPHDCSFVYQRGLNYHPRPVIQSYTAYDSFLDRINAQYFRERGPEYILFSNGCIDYRVCLYDDTQSKIAILEKYHVEKVVGDFALLKRSSQYTPFSITSAEKGRMRLGDRLSFPNDGKLRLVRFDIDYSLRGKIRRFLFQPPRLRMTIKTSQIKSDYRVVLPILNGGVLANIDVSTNESLGDFLNGNFAKVPRVEFVRLHSSESWGFTKYFDYEVYEIVR